MKNLLAYILKILSRLTIRRYKPFIIGVTGSAGKTSAKEAIYAALVTREAVRRTSFNFNNELGLPLSVLGSWGKITRPIVWFWFKVIAASIARLVIKNPSYPGVLVLEYGSDRTGDIGRLVKIARPDIGVITAIGRIPVHVENYPGGVEDVFKEKSKLIASLTASKTAVMNADDPFYEKLRERTRAHIVSFGFSPEADFRISHFAHTVKGGRIEGISFKVDHKNSHIPISIPSAFSVSHAYAAACALAVASERGINSVEASTYLHGYQPVHGRSVILDGIKRTQVIDESYNSSPIALETALKTLRMISHARRVAVLGDMLELGAYTLEAHEHAGEEVAVGAVDMLMTVGSRAKFIAHKALEKGMKRDRVFSFETAAEAGKKLQEVMEEGDIVLIKGSRSIGLDAVVEEVRKMG